MNQKLTEQIANHILSNLGIVPSSFVDAGQTRSVMDKQFILSEKIKFELDGNVFSKNIYGCQVSVVGDQEFKLLLADCTQEKNIPEYCLVAQLKDAPAFGIYLISNSSVDAEALIAVNSDKKHWVPCTTYLQATFLAGMEQLRDIGFGWSKCKNYKDLHEQLLLFIKYHDNYFGGYDEGQEI